MKKVSVFILLVIFQLTVFSQNTYITQLNKSFTSSKISVIPSTNEELAVWISNDLELHKFDKCGNSLWNKKFAFPDLTFSCMHNEMIAIKNGGYAFMTRETTGQVVSPRVTLLDALGNVIWSRVYHIPSISICSYSLMEDNFGNLYIYGNTSLLGGGSNYNAIIKLQANGTPLWAKHYNHGGIWGQAIITSDNGLLVRTGFILIKLNSLGNVQWTSKNWAPNLGNYYTPVEVSDGYIFTTITNGTNSINFHKIDKSGNQLWGGAKTLNFSGVNRKLLKNANGNIVSVFNKTINGKNLPTVIEFDKDLNVAATNSIQVSQPDIELIGYDINFVNNDIPVLVGTLDSLGVSKPFIAKLNTNYQSGCDTILPVTFGSLAVTNSLISTTAHTLNITETNTIFNPTSFALTTSLLCNSTQLSINLGKDTTLCQNASITLINLDPSLFDTFLWSTNETGSSISVNNSGTYWVTATDNCTGTTIGDTINIAVLDFPDPINLIKDTILCLDNSILLDAEHPGASYKWNDGSVLPYFSVSLPDTYFVDITYQGCIKRFFANVTGCEEYIIPNVFTPNNDGYNDLFEIVYNGDQEYHLLVYNRWGQLLFESKDKNHFWDGKRNAEKVPEGNYYYIFSLGEQSVKGSLSLLR